MIINGISHCNTGSWFTLSRVQVLSKTHITHLILFLAAANLTRLEQELVSFHPVCQEKLRNTVHTLLNHTKSSHQNPCSWCYDPRSSQTLMFSLWDLFRSSAKLLRNQCFRAKARTVWFCAHSQPLPKRSAFSMPVVSCPELSHLPFKGVIRQSPSEIYLGFSDLGNKTTQTQGEIFPIPHNVNWPHITWITSLKKNRNWLHLTVK